MPQSGFEREAWDTKGQRASQLAIRLSITSVICKLVVDYRLPRLLLVNDSTPQRGDSLRWTLSEDLFLELINHCLEEKKASCNLKLFGWGRGDIFCREAPHLFVYKHRARGSFSETINL
ncbi:hypothetical protein CEXT_472391 [Caerostris extrusa]|uniref:Uncharacterized protein n=1 Tax=Caerostris extrusa TaxID=172846 RepID=A0AAV4X1U0_CAEEX|nr:hypothetical protein CEXT_472391 [Caerostris extrusa]